MTLLYFFIFMIGASIGSFLNVCIYRLPLKQSIVSPPSPQNPIPSASPISTTLPQATPQITPSVGTAPDVSVGTLLISNNPPYVKMGSVIAFTAFIRDSSEAVVKNKTLE